MPFTGGSFISSESIVNDRTFIVKNSTSVSYTTTRTSGGLSDIKRYDFNTIVQDTDPVSVDISNNKVDVNTTTASQMIVSFEANIKVTNISGGTFAAGTTIAVGFDIIRKRGGIATTIGTMQLNFNAGGLVSSGTLTLPLFITSKEIDTDSGDELYIDFIWFSTLNPSFVKVDILQNGVFRNSPSSKYTEGDIINISSVLPREIKQKDFLTWLFRAFNLYAIPDTIDANKLIIEPRDEFYTSDVVDITNNLDVSSELMINPMGVLDFRDFVLKYKEDKDEYNTKYQELFGEVYSTKKFTVENDFLTQTNTVEIGFSPSPLANSNGYHDRIFTKIRKLDPNSGNSELPSYNIRMLIYGGLVATSQGWQIKTKLSGTSFIIVGFPYAGMLDSTSAPTFDLGFAQPKAIYYVIGSTAYTNGNLFNRYWK
jgi:hypothetical protein